MKNASTSSTKGVAWGSAVKSCAPGYRQVGGESHAGSPGSQFIGDTKGNRDLKPERSSGVSTGHGGGQHKAGG
jgi:hypothetical protein